MKGDIGKLRWSLLPLDSVEDVVRVLEFGARKYAVDNWKQVPNAKVRYADALMRHAVDYLRGVRADPESGLPTLAHLVCDALFLLWFDRHDQPQE